MALIDLSQGLPESLSSDSQLYCLGVGGPLDESGIGRPDRFVWRYALLLDPDAAEAPCLLAFSSMPGLMQFTRAVNGRAPFTLPTEVRRQAAGDLSGQALRLLLDPSVETFEALSGGRAVAEQHLPQLEA